MRILISGSLAYDKIMNYPGYFRDSFVVDKIHNINVSFLVDGLKESFGGTAGNIAYNLALLSETPTVLATAGDDFSKYKNWLSAKKVDTSKIKIIESELTAFANIMTDNGDNQIAAFYPGAMKYAVETPRWDVSESSDKTNQEMPNRGVSTEIGLIAAGNMDDMVNLAKIYADKNIPYIYDPSQQIPALSEDALRDGIKGAKIFISNDYELSLVSKKTGWSEEEIEKNVEILVTTLGEKGSIIKTKGEVYEIPPAKIEKIVDPTGAGDAYRAGLIKGLLEDWSLEKTGKFAGVVAAYAVENQGTQNHEFTLDDIWRRFEENFK